MRIQGTLAIHYCLADLHAKLLLPFICFMLCNSSCNPETGGRSRQMTAIFEIVNTLPEDNHKQIHVLDSAFNLLKKPGIEDRLEVYAFKCAFYQRQRDFAEAFNYSDSMIDLTENKINQTRFAKWYSSALASKGDIYLAVKNYDESFLCYTKARVIYEKVSTDTCSRQGYTQRLANLLYKQKKFQSAADYFNLALKEINCSSVTNPFLTFVYNQPSFCRE